MGRHEVGFVDNTKKNELNGGKGCNFEASFQINKVPGNFHVSTHSAERQPDVIDMSHVIHDLTFGEDISETKIKGSFNALKFRSKLDGHCEFKKVNFCPRITFSPLHFVVDLQHWKRTNTT